MLHLQNLQMRIEGALRAGATLDDIAKRCGVSKGQVERWRDGRDKVAYSDLDAILQCVQDCVRARNGS